MAAAATPYVGRFAPSPTGPLHFGSLLAACASYLDARRRNGSWLLRIEDIDPPREQAGASDDIVRTLERFGFEWDGEVIFQSQSAALHDAALERLQAAGRLFYCRCSRRDLQSAKAGPLGRVYPGHCRSAGHADGAIRFRITPETLRFVDGLQGPQTLDMQRESGDFVVWRRDGLVAYQLAVVADDLAEGITHVVRGIDLIESTFRQLALFEALGERPPAYSHIPVAVHADGDKLSKLTAARAIDPAVANRQLYEALSTLGQDPPPALATAALSDVWDWALAHWDGARMAGIREITVAGQQTALPRQ